MSKFFYKDRPTHMINNRSVDYKTKKVLKLGTKVNPATVYVQTEESGEQQQALANEHDISIKIIVAEDKPENTRELDSLLTKAKTQIKVKVPARNEPCLCGSGKKYKKCCAA
ncbi:MAG: SEC-C metal-binding domain-containing protein [Endozoicomonas sp. (ex Botrylloides leachii)]|nr:SEC-C metal-binding domain-containing protein [Endozoicomonas sp. (ex Botrylloides leachii)]